MQMQTKKLYTLGSLWFYLTHKDFSFADYISKALSEKIDIISAVDKEKINQYFSSAKEEDIDIIDQDSRSKTFLLLGKKRQNDPFETVISEEDYKSLFNNKGESDNVIIFFYTKYLFDAQINDSKMLESVDPNLRVIEYLLKKEKKIINRNLIMRSSVSHVSYKSYI